MKWMVVFLAFISFTAWAQDLPDKPLQEIEEQTDTITASLIDQIIVDGKMYLGYKYRARLESGHIFDCSGYVNYLFGKHNIPTARSSAEIAREVQEISIEEARPGDLLFFKGRDVNSSRIGHVAMVVENNGQGVMMMHASRRGIVLEPFKDAYYTRRFVHAGRLPMFYDPAPDIHQEPPPAEKTTEEHDFPQ